MPIAPAVAGGLIQAGSNLVDSAIQGFTNRANRKWSEKMYKWQRADSIADWNRQNEYNDPSSQMSRLKAAGLNPNLVYGTGIQAAGNAAPVRGASPGSGNAVAPKLNLGNAIATYINLKQADASIELKNQQTTLAAIKGIVEAIKGTNIQADTKLKNIDADAKVFDLNLKKDMRDLTVDAARAYLAKTIADTQFTIDQNTRAAALQAPMISKMIAEAALIRMNTAKSEQEIEEIKQRVKVLIQDERIRKYDADLKAKGLQPGDWIWWRKITGWLDGTISNIGDVFEPDNSDNVNTNTTSGVKR